VILEGASLRAAEKTSRSGTTEFLPLASSFRRALASDDDFFGGLILKFFLYISKQPGCR
jgi:hypothetical protein